MVADWWTHRAAGRDAVLAATTRSDVRDLNARAHAALETAGQLGPLAATVDDQRFCVGDRVLALRNRYDLGILNGDFAEITGADERTVAVRVDDGRSVDLPLDYVAHHLQHAYARTVHKSQGLTCDVALLLGDDALYAELGYTGLTRGRTENHLYVVTSTDRDDDGRPCLTELIAALDVSRAKTAALDATDPAVQR